MYKLTIQHSISYTGSINVLEIIYYSITQHRTHISNNELFFGNRNRLYKIGFRIVGDGQII